MGPDLYGAIPLYTSNAIYCSSSTSRRVGSSAVSTTAGYERSLRQQRGADALMQAMDGS